MAGLPVADGQHLEITRAGAMPDDIREDWRRFPASAAVPLSAVGRTGQAVFLESRADWAAQYPNPLPPLEATGQHANAVMPLVVDGRVLGVLGVAFMGRARSRRTPARWRGSLRCSAPRPSSARACSRRSDVP